MPNEDMPEFPAALRDRFKLEESEVQEITKYVMDSMRAQMRNEFYRDVGRGVVRYGWRTLLCIAAYLAWKGTGGSGGWLEPLRKFFIG